MTQKDPSELQPELDLDIDIEALKATSQPQETPTRLEGDFTIHAAMADATLAHMVEHACKQQGVALDSPRYALTLEYLIEKRRRMHQEIAEAIQVNYLKYDERELDEIHGLTGPHTVEVNLHNCHYVLSFDLSILSTQHMKIFDMTAFLNDTFAMCAHSEEEINAAKEVLKAHTREIILAAPLSLAQG